MSVIFDPARNFYTFFFLPHSSRAFAAGFSTEKSYGKDNEAAGLLSQTRRLIIIGRKSMLIGKNQSSVFGISI